MGVYFMAKFVGEKQLGVNIANGDATAMHTLGSRVHMNDGSQYVYVKSINTCNLGDFVKIVLGDASAPFAVTPTTAATDQAVGVAQIAISAGAFGWILVKGKMPSANVVTGAVAGTIIIPSATAGRCTSIAAADVVAGVAIVLVTAASNLADVYLIGVGL